MIVCTRCGASNEDSEISCGSCGHKLQSIRRPGQPERPVAETLRPLGAGQQGERFQAMLRRCLEVWVVVAATLGFALWGMAGGRWWLGLVGVALGGGYVLLRR